MNSTTKPSLILLASLLLTTGFTFASGDILQQTEEKCYSCNPECCEPECCTCEPEPCKPGCCEPECCIERDFTFDFSAKLRIGDSFYAKNIYLLNNCVPGDRFFYMRHTLDLNLDVIYAEPDSDPTAEVKFSARNRAIWGSPNIVPTTVGTTKLLEFSGQPHRHHIARHISWIRELWLELCLNDISGICFNDKRQTFTLGAFSFELGRGIALGDAYAVGPDYLGYYFEDPVDQYAFGAKLSGEIVKEKLTYDIYFGLLGNRSSILSDTGAKIFAQQYGRLNRPQRGFGILNTVVAGKLFWTAIDDEEKGTLTVEPYCLVNTDKEQRIEFRGDAQSRLGTIGLACEFERPKFECGFDCAVNMGHQCAKGWDRNRIDVQDRNGKLVFVNSHAYVGLDPNKKEDNKDLNIKAYQAPQSAVTTLTDDATKDDNKIGSTAQDIINTAVRNETFNGRQIGQVDNFADAVDAPDPVDEDLKDKIFNAVDRFRNPYAVKFQGYMFVFDAAWYLHCRDIRIAATIGYASGDADPHFLQKDGDYEGFIPLQELYNGKRVKSAFYLGSGRLRLPLDTLTTEEKVERLARNVSRFTNLGFIGTGIKWEPHCWKKRFFINPNILAYWQPWPARKFDLQKQRLLPQQASSFLGVELNTYFEKDLLKGLNFYGTISLFIPGKHFDDVLGKPISKEQIKFLDRLDKTAYNGERVPNLWNDKAFTINLGFEYEF